MSSKRRKSATPRVEYEAHCFGDCGEFETFTTKRMAQRYVRAHLAKGHKVDVYVYHHVSGARFVGARNQ